MGLVCPEKGWKTVVWEGRDEGGASLRWEVFASHPELGGHHFPDGKRGAGDAYTEVVLVLETQASWATLHTLNARG